MKNIFKSLMVSLLVCLLAVRTNAQSVASDKAIPAVAQTASSTTVNDKPVLASAEKTKPVVGDTKQMPAKDSATLQKVNAAVAKLPLASDQGAVKPITVEATKEVKVVPMQSDKVEQKPLEKPKQL